MLEIAQIQLNPKLGHCEYNLKRIESLLDQASKADLIILPELANTGYKFDNRDQAYAMASDPTCLKYVEFIRDYSRDNKVNIISGYLEKEGDKLFNSAIFIKPDGSGGKYRKIHLFMNEKNIFAPGNLGLPIFDLGKYKLGILICFDYLFPEIWRIMALKGADFIVHPSNLITQNAHKVVPAQAIMNGYYVITTNRIGTEGDITFCGNSFISDPRGNIISEMDRVNEGIKITTVNPLLSRDKMITTGNHILNDRLPDNYFELFSLK